MAQLAKIETKQVRISKEHLLKEKELFLQDLDKSERKKQIMYTIFTFLFIGSSMIDGRAQLLAMGIVVLAFVWISIYKSPEVLHVEKQIHEIDEKLSMFDSHPEKIQSEFERPRRVKGNSGNTHETKSNHRKAKRKQGSDSKINNQNTDTKSHQKNSQSKAHDRTEAGTKSRNRRRNKNRAPKKD